MEELSNRAFITFEQLADPELDPPDNRYVTSQTFYDSVASFPCLYVGSTGKITQSVSVNASPAT